MMAFMEMNMDEQLALTINDEDIEEMLSVGASILQKSMQQEIQRVTGDVSTGEAARSIKFKEPLRAKNGAWIVNVTATGNSSTHYVRGKGAQKRTYKVSNALKLIWLQYGRKGQKARPWLDAATRKADAEVQKAMEEVYKRKVEK